MRSRNKLCQFVCRIIIVTDSFTLGKREKNCEETTSFPDIISLERKGPWDAVTVILSSPSGLADAREQLKPTTRKAQHTPETLDSLGMIITLSPFPVPSLRPLAAVGSQSSRDELTDRGTDRSTTARRSHRRQPF